MPDKAKSFEEMLTPANRAIVRTYIYNCNESLYASMILEAFNKSVGMPISNAFYIHELTELELFMAHGYDFINVTPDSAFREYRARMYDENRHFNLHATRQHCRYFQQHAQSLGCCLSLGTVIEYDPLSSRQDKDELYQKSQRLCAAQSEKQAAMQYFSNLARAEKGMFDCAINFGSSDIYRDIIFT